MDWEHKCIPLATPLHLMYMMVQILISLSLSLPFLIFPLSIPTPCN